VNQVGKDNSLEPQKQVRPTKVTAPRQNTAKQLDISIPQILASAFGVLTLLFFMYITLYPVPCDNRWSAVSVLALGSAFSFAIMSGDAALRGRIPPTILSEKFQKENYFVTALTGGVAVFFLVFILAYPMMAKLSPCLPQKVEAINPFGERQVLIGGNKLLVTSNDIKATQGNDTQLMTATKHLFQMRLPDKSENFQLEELSGVQYAAKLSPIPTESVLGRLAEFNNPFIGASTVYRLFKPHPISLELTTTSALGPRLSHEEMADVEKTMLKNMGSGFGRILDALNKTELLDKAPLNKSPEEKGEEIAKILHQMSGIPLNSQVTIPFFNELSIVLIDRRDFERRLAFANGGRRVEASPFLVMLSVGADLPRLDTLAIKQASVSEDNRVWAFYGQTEYQNVKIDGVPTASVFQDFYRLYVANSAYIYQITLSYIPHPSQPRSTWDALVKVLQSLKIAA